MIAVNRAVDGGRWVRTEDTRVEGCYTFVPEEQDDDDDDDDDANAPMSKL